MSEVRAHLAESVSQNDWQELQAVARLLCQATMEATPAEIDTYVGQDNPERFVETHQYPNHAVGHEFRPNQAYYFPRVFVASKNGEPVGWLYAAHNVSGPGKPTEPHAGSLRAQAYRLRKELSVIKSHFWVREIFSPDEETTRQLLRRSLQHVMARRRFAAYVDRDLFSRDAHAPELVLLTLGLDEQEHRTNKPFGQNGRTSPRITVRGSVGAARRNLRTQ